MKKIDHIGIAVKDLKSSDTLFSKLFNRAPFHRELVESQHLNVSFFQLDDTLVELLEPTSEKSAIYKFLLSRGEGIHHVCFETEDIYAEMERLKKEGFQPLTDGPYIGAMGKLVCFFHPKTTNGMLVEICQKTK